MAQSSLQTLLFHHVDERFHCCACNTVTILSLSVALTIFVHYIHESVHHVHVGIRWASFLWHLFCACKTCCRVWIYARSIAVWAVTILPRIVILLFLPVVVSTGSSLLSSCGLSQDTPTLCEISWSVVADSTFQRRRIWQDLVLTANSIVYILERPWAPAITLECTLRHMYVKADTLHPGE